MKRDITGGNSQSRLKKLLEAWKRVGRKLGDFQARFILVVFYYTVLAPFALVIRFAGDPLAIKASSSKGWCAISTTRSQSIENAMRQF